MISKILEYNAIPNFTQNKELNRMALKAILMASNEPYYDKYGVTKNYTYLIISTQYKIYIFWRKRRW